LLRKGVGNKMGIFEGKFLVASGPVIIENGRLLVDKDEKDDFWKLPGGTINEGEELEDACKRKVKEEINGEIEIIKPLYPKILYENPTTKEKMKIILINYLAKLLNPNEIKSSGNTQEIKWVEIKEILENNKANVSPNTLHLIKKMNEANETKFIGAFK
jgi:mutator protein MutT